jgi:uncharacterized small protein (DUF1192 family)
MSGVKKTLFSLLDEQKKLQESQLNSRQSLVENQVQGFMTRVSGINDHIQHRTLELQAGIENLASRLEGERRDRNLFEERKAAEGKQIGQLYWENLHSIGSAAQEKVDQVKAELADSHQSVHNAHSSFLRLHESLEKDTPKSYLTQAGIHKADFTQRKFALEEKARDLEISVQREFGSVAEQRVRTVDDLEQRIAATRQEVATDSSRLAAEIQARSAGIRDFLTRFAQQLQLTP